MYLTQLQTNVKYAFDTYPPLWVGPFFITIHFVMFILGKVGQGLGALCPSGHEEEAECPRHGKNANGDEPKGKKKKKTAPQLANQAHN